MNAPETRYLPDVQAMGSPHPIAIDQVGIRGLRFPIHLRSASGESLTSVADFQMTVALPPEIKGTHMSRFVEALEAQGERILDADAFEALVRDVAVRLDAARADVRMRFTYFLRKAAPISGVSSLLDVEAEWRGRIENGQFAFEQTVVVPVTSLCPCSKQISAYGAHNQRSHITIRATLAEPVALEELIAVAEAQASCEVYGLLKRVDEKYVTERAYENPKFVEDLVRDVAAALNADSRILAYRVESENFESIHNHSAYACIEFDKRDH